MIKQLRIDDKLYNKAATMASFKDVGASVLLIVDDAAAGDNLFKEGIRMQVPVDVKLQIRGVEESIRLLKDPRAEKMCLFLVCSQAKTALKLVESLPVAEVNAANYRKKKSSAKSKLNDYLSVDEEDMEAFKRMDELTGGNVFSQLIPTFKREYFRNLIKDAPPV